MFIVTATHQQHHESTLDLTIDGEIIHTTDEHPFLVKDSEEYRWVEAKHLDIGDKVVASDGSFGVIEAVTVIDEPQTMYNLTVALAHTFIIGQGQWVVHNTSNQEVRDLLQRGASILNVQLSQIVDEAQFISIADLRRLTGRSGLAAMDDLYLQQTGRVRIRVTEGVFAKVAQLQEHLAVHELVHARHFNQLANQMGTANAIQHWLSNFDPRGALRGNPQIATNYFAREILTEDVAYTHMRLQYGDALDQQVIDWHESYSKAQLIQCPF